MAVHIVSTSGDNPLFPRLLELSEAERENFLRRMCAANPEFARELAAGMSGLSATSTSDRPAETKWEDPWSGLDPRQTAASAFEAALHLGISENSGARIGPYKLLQKIGEGGFGVVWMAEQAEPMNRRVALKIVKVGMDTEEVIARFAAERQALARMEHANIARVFDAGATESGRPYFVMELVRGVAITRFCDENRLLPEARLRLFITVCQAVQHAHQKGVIHRDLKPSNILVTLHDGVAVPKIIDFGIAKATSGRLTEKTLFTQFNAFLGTPVYTSPEQMEMSGLDVDTRSDIYSLGVLLYELLTGQPPFDAKVLAKSGLEAMRRTILEVDPPRPSHRLGTLSEVTRSSVAHQRSINANELSLLLRGDLDWIVMRCLEKDRRRRYPSAASLAADIDRHLRDDLVEARPPSQIYRAKKFVRRHQLAVWAAAAVAAALIAGLIVSSTLLVGERSARERAIVAEKRESELRRQAEIGRANEVKRAARTALDLASRHLADGRIADGLAYLVYGARKDPQNMTLGPRLISALATHNFLLPEGEPFECGSPVRAVRYTKDGRSVQVGTEDGALRLFEAASGAFQHEIRLGRPVAPGGWKFPRYNDEMFAVCFADLEFGVFDVKSGQPRWPPRALPKGVEPGRDASGMVGPGAGISPDGRWLYALRGPQFWIWDAATGQLLLDQTSRDGVSFSECDFTADGAQLAVTVGRTAKRWTLPDAKPIAGRLEDGDEKRWLRVKFSPSGRVVALSGYRQNIELFDTMTGRPLRTLAVPDELTGHNSFLFASDRRVFLGSGRASGSWDVSTGAFRALPFAARRDLFNISFDAAGNRVLWGGADGFVQIGDLDSGEPIAESMWRRRLACATLAPDGMHLTTGTTTGTVQRFRVGRGAVRPLVLPRVPSNMPMTFLAGSPARFLRMKATEARVVDTTSGRETGEGFAYPAPVLAPPAVLPGADSAVRQDGRFAVVLTDRGWQAWELGPNGVAHSVTLKGVTDEGTRVRFSPRGDLVAFALSGGFGVWNMRTGALAGPIFARNSTSIWPITVDFSPDGERVMCGTFDGACLLVEVATARVIQSIHARPHVALNSVVWSPDATRVILANVRDDVRMWNAVTGKPISALIENAEAKSTGVARFSPDGRWFVMWGQQSTRIRDGQTGLPAGETISVGGGPACFTPDSRSLGTTDSDGAARVWDVPGGLPFTESMRHGSHRRGSRGLRFPEFSPEGRFLRIESPDEYQVWSVPPRLPEGMPVPEWVLQLASALAAKTVNDAGELVELPDATARFHAVRRQIAALPEDAPLADWARWILDDRAERPIAPGFTLTGAEADQLAASDRARRETKP